MNDRDPAVTKRGLRGARRLAAVAWQTVGVRHEELVFFAYDSRQGTGLVDQRVQLVSGRDSISATVAAEFTRSFGRVAWLIWRLRMAIRGVTLLYLSEGGRVLAYGSVWPSDPLVRRYRWLAPRAYVLGPFWTDPAARRRGHYQTLLSAAIALSRRRPELPAIIFADATNEASIRGIEKAGFARLGTYRVEAAVLSLLCRHETVEQVATIVDPDQDAD